MIKSRLFNGILFSFVVIFSIVLGEYALKLKGVKRFQTWLEMNEKGFVENRSNFKALGFTTDSTIIYSIDKYGLRETESVITHDSSTKILVLGDSFAFGLYLKDEDTILHQLNKETNSSILFYNGGVGGSGSADQLWNFRKYSSEIKFDEVIILMNYDDVDRTINQNLFVLENGKLIESQRYKPTFWYYFIHHSQWHSFLEKNSRLYFYRSKLFWKYLFFYDDYKFYSEKTKYLWPKVESLYASNEYSTKMWVKLLELFKNECESSQIKLKLVTTGTPADSLRNPHTYKIYNQLDSLVHEIGIPLIDLRTVLLEKSEGDLRKLQLYPDDHPNPKAAKIIAQEILKVWYRDKINEK